MNFSPLDHTIKECEILHCIGKLKNNKATGCDRICNEMLQNAKHTLTPTLKNLFNLIFSTGSFPTTWSGSLTRPIYKSGSKLLPTNYRGISLSSCLGKLFCMILNERLINYLEENKLMTPLQIAFRKNCRTNDHIFTLKTLIDKYTNLDNRGKTKSLYTCFIDFRKAFDTVWQEGLLHKLLDIGIGRNFYSIIKDMYKKNCGQIKLKQGLTDTFPVELGVKQGCVLSPTLFNIYLNDLPNYLMSNSTDPVSLQNDSLNCLMYADDLVLLSTTAEGLQKCIDKVKEYCQNWKLNLNVQKTKIIIFNKQGKINKKLRFTFNGNEIEIVKQTKYLGIVFSNNCSFKSAITSLKDKSNKALFKIYKSFGDSSRPIKIMSQLFDAMVSPIQTYGSDIWGAYSLNIEKLLTISAGKTQLFFKQEHEKLHTSWCKYTLQVHEKSPNIAVLAELGRYPTSINIMINMIKYWIRLNKLTESNHLLKLSYQTNLEMLRLGKPCWLNSIYKILHELGLDYIWENCGGSNITKTIRTVKDALLENFCKQFHLDLFNDTRNNNEGNKLRTFRTFKSDIKLETYLLAFHNPSLRKYFTRLRISAHNLAIEIGRHHKPHKIPVHDRLCTNCNSNMIEDEQHIIMSCNKFHTFRKELLSSLNETFINFKDLDTSAKFQQIMNCSDYESCKILEKFIGQITKIRGPL